MARSADDNSILLPFQEGTFLAQFCFVVTMKVDALTKHL